jgi:hypothetical protein
VIAVKQSGGDIHKLAALLRSNRGRLQVLTAIDDLLYPSFMLGAVGTIAAVSTVVPTWQWRSGMPASAASTGRPARSTSASCRSGRRSTTRTCHRGSKPPSSCAAASWPGAPPTAPGLGRVRREIADALEEAGVLPAATVS